MLIATMVKWWYSVGWKDFIGRLKDRLARAVDFFSITSLLRTLFSPFRQISAGQVDGALDVRLRAFFDRLFSRVIGAIVRLGILLFGLILMTIESVIGIVLIILWPLVPVIPIISIVLVVMQVTF